MIIDYFLFSVKGLRRRKLRSWLTMIGIFIGIAAIVSLMSLGQGMRDAITSQFASIGTDKIIIQAASSVYGAPGAGAVNPLNTAESDTIERINGVKLVAERMIRSANMEFKDQEKYVTVSNLPGGEAGELIVEAMQIEIERGRMLMDRDSSKVILGDNFYSKKTFDKPIDVGSRITIEGRSFEVVGIMARKGNPMMNSIVVLPDDAFRKTIDVEDEVDVIVAQVQPGVEISKIVEVVEKKLRKERGVEKGKEDFSVQTAQQAIDTLNTILNVVQWVLVGIAGISLLVGGIGIMNTMFTSILERRREIGIMKSIGARNRSVLLIFLIESGLLGVTGGLIGIIIGVIFGKTVQIIGQQVLNSPLLQANFSFWLIFGTLMFSFFVGSISGVMPAFQASRLHPVDALRK